MANYDLGMLRVFLLIYETGSVTLASQKLFLSQPSVSYTLRKLREHFKDPLFERKGNQFAPTHMARDLYPKLRHLVGSLDEIMQGPSTFDPETASRSFRLRMTDVGVSGLLPPILHTVRDQAPRVTLAVETLNFATVVDDLQTGAADVAICTTPLDEQELAREVLFSQDYVGLCSADHPRIPEEPTLGSYEDEEHITVASSTGHTGLDARVRELGVHRKVVAVVPHFSSLPNLLEGSDLIAYAPSSVARRMIGRYSLRTFRLPFDLPTTQVSVYTLKREFPAADLQWFIELLHRCIQERYHYPPTETHDMGGFI